jgi:hypothetical protein
MTLKVEGVVNGGMHAEETLGGSSRFKSLPVASCALVAVQAGASSPPDCCSEAPVRVGRSVANDGTPSRRSAACRSQVIRRKPVLLRSLRISRSAARLSRRPWTGMSRTSPSVVHGTPEIPCGYPRQAQVLCLLQFKQALAIRNRAERRSVPMPVVEIARVQILSAASSLVGRLLDTSSSQKKILHSDCSWPPR